MSERATVFLHHCGAVAPTRADLPEHGADGHACRGFAKQVYADSIKNKTLEGGTTIVYADGVSAFDAHGGVADRGPRQ